MIVFIVALALHVVVIGGISAYHIMRGDDKDARELAVASGRDSTGSADGTGSSGAPVDPMIPSGDATSSTAPVAPVPASSTDLTFTQPATLPDAGTPRGPAPLPEEPASAPAYDPTASAPRAEALPDSEQPVPHGLGRHTVKRGETLARIAARYNVSVDDLMEINNLTSPTVKTGDRILLERSRSATTTASSTQSPRTRTAAPSTTTTTDKSKDKTAVASDKDKSSDKKSKDKDKATTTAKAESRKYKVDEGDTIFYIAKRFNTTPAAIRAANGMAENATRPKVGSTLTIPGGSPRDVAKRN